jgi:hypothetical protein
MSTQGNLSANYAVHGVGEKRIAHSAMSRLKYAQMAKVGQVSAVPKLNANDAICDP